jgi:hypothetical protein
VRCDEMSQTSLQVCGWMFCVSGEQQLTRPNNSRSRQRQQQESKLRIVCGRKQQQQRGGLGRGGGIIKYGRQRHTASTVSWERRSPGQKVGGNAVLLRGACGGYGPKRRTRPCMQTQTRMCEEKRQKTTSTGEQQPWKVTLGARMQRCKTRHHP